MRLRMSFADHFNIYPPTHWTNSFRLRYLSRYYGLLQAERREGMLHENSLYYSMLLLVQPEHCVVHFEFYISYPGTSRKLIYITDIWPSICMRRVNSRLFSV